MALQGMDSSQRGGDTLAAPFVGFVIGTVYVLRNPSAFKDLTSIFRRFFGITLLQTYQYFLRYPNDSRRSKIKVGLALSSMERCIDI